MKKNINSRRFFIRSIKALAIIVSFLMANVLYAEEVTNRTVLTVKIAVDTAVRDNPGLAEMQARYEAMAEIPSQMGTLPDPVLSFGAMNFPTDTFDRDQEAMTKVHIDIFGAR